MREHYSTVGLDEKRAAVASVLRRSFPGEKVRTTVRTPARRRTTQRRRGLRSRELIRVPPSGRWNHERKLVALGGSCSQGLLLIAVAHPADAVGVVEHAELGASEGDVDQVAAGRRHAGY